MPEDNEGHPMQPGPGVGGIDYQSPATHIPLSQTPHSVNQKTDEGKSGEVN